MSNNASANNSFAAQLIAIMEDGWQKEIAATAEWAAFAGQMETQNGVNKITARTEYEDNNECSNIWSALYGNTTDTTFVPERGAELDNRTRFCARLNVSYWQDRVDAHRTNNPHLDPSAIEWNELEAANDLEYANMLVNYNEAILNMNRLLAKLYRLRATYEFKTDSAFVYKPYNVTVKKSTHPQNASLASKIIADMTKRTAPKVTPLYEEKDRYADAQRGAA